MRRFTGEQDEAGEVDATLSPDAAITSDASRVSMGFCNNLPGDPNRNGTLNGGFVPVIYNGVEWCPSDPDPVEWLLSTQGQLRDGGLS